MFKPVSAYASEATRDTLVIAPHHPDRLRRPAVGGSGVAQERCQQAFAWNVFRTLELLPPAFWIRRLHARLGAEHFPAAAQTSRIHLWRSLPLPPAQRIDGAKADVVVDVTIETELAVWTLMLASDRDQRVFDSDVSTGDPIARIIDAAAWRAGTRAHYFGIVEARTTATSIGSVLKRRYSRSRDSVHLRSADRWGVRTHVDVLGVLEWADLIEILRDCERATALSPIERALARNALAWIEQSGVDQFEMVGGAL
jgi:hypothetical protein